MDNQPLLPVPEASIVVQAFVPGTPVAQPRSRFRSLLPSIDKIHSAVKQLSAGMHHRDRAFSQLFRKWLVKSTTTILQDVKADQPIHQWKRALKQNVRVPSAIDGPLLVDTYFVFPRPVSKTRKTKPNLRYWHCQSPDVDNLLKAVWDALSNQVWIDDKQVVRGEFGSCVAGDGDRSGALIRVRLADQQPVRFPDWAEELIREPEKPF